MAQRRAERGLRAAKAMRARVQEEVARELAARVRVCPPRLHTSVDGAFRFIPSHSEWPPANSWRAACCFVEAFYVWTLLYTSSKVVLTLLSPFASSPSYSTHLLAAELSPLSAESK